MFGNSHELSTVDTEASRALGLASIAIGLAEIAMPGKVQDLLGLDDSPRRRGILRVLGVREICHGLAILTDDKPQQRMARNLWSRVAGDVLDSALLAKAAQQTNSPSSFAAVAASVAAIGVADLVMAERLSHDA
jgi:hypothetical protein